MGEQGASLRDAHSLRGLRIFGQTVRSVMERPTELLASRDALLRSAGAPADPRGDHAQRRPLRRPEAHLVARASLFESEYRMTPTGATTGCPFTDAPAPRDPGGRQ